MRDAASLASTAPPGGIGSDGSAMLPGRSFGQASFAATSAPKVTLWRDTEESWLSSSLVEIPKPEMPRTSGEQEPPLAVKRTDVVKAPLVSVVNESAAPGTTEAWARDAIKMKSYREMARAMREGKYVGRVQKAPDEAAVNSGKPDLAGAAKPGKPLAVRHARFADDNPFADEPVEPVEWEGIEKSWLRQRLALTH